MFSKFTNKCPVNGNTTLYEADVCLKTLQGQIGREMGLKVESAHVPYVVCTNYWIIDWINGLINSIYRLLIYLQLMNRMLEFQNSEIHKNNMFWKRLAVFLEFLLGVLVSPRIKISGFGAWWRIPKSRNHRMSSFGPSRKQIGILLYQIEAE